MSNHNVVLHLQSDDPTSALGVARDSACIIKRGMEHDNKYLDVVLSPLEGQAGPKKINTRSYDYNTLLAR